MKRTITWSVTTLLSVAALAAQNEPQDPKTGEHKQQTATRASDQFALSEVIGAKVRLQAEPTAADGRANPDVRVDTTDRPTGSVEDLVVDSRTGRAEWAVVSVGGILGIGDKNVAVPTSSMKFVRADDEEPIFEIAATKDELKTLDAFDKSIDLKTAVSRAEAAWRPLRKTPAGHDGNGNGNGDGNGNGNRARGRGVADSGARGIDGKPAEGAYGQAAGYLLGSKIDGLSVKARGTEKGDDFGEVEAAAFDPHRNQITFLVVGRGGVLGIGESEYLVPFKATNVVLTGDDREPALMLPKSAAELETAPKYKKPDNGIVTDEAVRASGAFYGVDMEKDGALDRNRDMRKDDVRKDDMNKGGARKSGDGRGN